MRIPVIYVLSTATCNFSARSSKTAQAYQRRGMRRRILNSRLPPLAEQRRIAEVLDRAEALRAKRRAALAQLDSLTQSLFLDLFGDPVIPRLASDKHAWRLLCTLSSIQHGSVWSQRTS